MTRRLILFALMVIVFVFVLVSYVSVLRTDYRVTAQFVNISLILLFIFLVLLIVRFFVLLYLSYLHHVDRMRIPNMRAAYQRNPASLFLPSASIIVPCYNEGVVVENSIRSLLEVTYPNLEIVVVDDGSTDDTYVRALRYAGRHGHCVVTVLRQKNRGKGEALNYGIGYAKGEMLVCVDADSRLEPDSLLYAMQHFRNPAVGAVAGNVKVGNRCNLLTRLQALEYIEGLNMVRRSQGYFSAVNIIPGPIGVFRRSVLEDVGGYDRDTFAEDCDITIKILTRGWKIAYEPFSIAVTEAPENFIDFFRQRYRWTRGILQALRKHRRFMMHGFWKHHSFALWYMCFEALIWPAMNIFAQIYFLYVVIFFDMSMFVIFWWGQLTVLDIVAALFCIGMEEEDFRLTPYAILYRLFFVVITDVCKVIATVEELLQVRMGWGKLQRKGRTQ